ncbi:efflux RND transporter periplasmic adaptor subunit [Candidatus Trichorickettsia mobilis]|uniref:efflux RND transporter periplasmic adaptor subunit n=1 Tax=Candidatus Trichorickettsia mobilis TaxID=1346319 RepID=UPI00292ED772|nr:efflux RND transporter periplasmic adaptor subunit [Candidatus Trichorickettsia mobilis]
MLRKLILTFVIILVSINSNAAWQKPIFIKPVIVCSAELFDKFNVAGLLRNEKNHDYYANVAGTVDFISPQQGQKITKSNLIISIDSALAETVHSKAQAALHLANISYARDQALFAKKVISFDTLDKSKLALEQAKFELATAMNTYNNMIITAPFDGEIGVSKLRVGDHVNVGDYLFSIVAGQAQTIILELPESLRKAVHTNTEVKITDSLGNVATSNVSSISQYLSENGTVRIQVNLNDKPQFTHGSYVQAELTINKHRGLAVPSPAVLQNENGDFVYQIGDNNLIKQVYVKLGTRTNNLIEIISDNLNEGDQIVLEGLTKVQDGVTVKILD